MFFTSFSIEKLLFSFFDAFQLVSTFILIQFLLLLFLHDKKEVYTCEFLCDWMKLLFIPVLGFVLGSISFCYRRKIFFNDLLPMSYHSGVCCFLSLFFIFFYIIIVLVLKRFSGCSER